jgi:hypothetical protein
LKKKLELAKEQELYQTLKAKTVDPKSQRQQERDHSHARQGL